MLADGTNSIIWILREKISPPVFSQQRPRWTAGRPIPVINMVRPWHGVRPDLANLNKAPKFPNVVHELLPKPPTKLAITGITKDSLGNVLGNCEVMLFRSDNEMIQSVGDSDSNGSYTFYVGASLSYYIVAYKSGSPDVAGTTVNSLTGTL